MIGKCITFSFLSETPLFYLTFLLQFVSLLHQFMEPKRVLKTICSGNQTAKVSDQQMNPLNIEHKTHMHDADVNHPEGPGREM